MHFCLKLLTSYQQHKMRVYKMRTEKNLDEAKALKAVCNLK